ncbi:hypothetical protein A3860_38755 [Niastella vici]|uniref:Carbohydrate-binding protein SusD n=1 Tax=Niastella vici TaxID=1703345 RepID=A0A1V9FL95_9BACT|nr:RagB/SusD family nutrient uptake outer membrane protein [Niastella vici]OQP59112.1 hypothetical protein A3860_38755 [Niastella vici]
MSRSLIAVILFTWLTILDCGCKKLVDVKAPNNVITANSVYNSDVTSIAVLNGLYTQMSTNNYGSTATIPTVSMWAGLSADELTLWKGTTSISQIAYYKNELSATTAGGDFWMNIYPYIYTCNAAIGGLESSVSLTPAVKNQLLGEAKFLRAYFYFYLVNLYGDIPLVLSTDYKINASLSRTPTSVVYNQITADLQAAQNLLTDGYVKSDALTLYSSSAERVRPCKAAATALLARTYLYTSKWTDAEAQATGVISNTAVYDTVPLNKVFLKNSKEAIWQLQPVTTGTITNTADAYSFVLSVPPVGLNFQHPVYLSDTLINSFETGDQRRTNGNWVNVYNDVTGTYYYPYKYKNVTQGTGVTPTEYTMLLRLGEQYLIRAEARAQQGNITGAQSDLNVIRRRAGLSNTTANDKSSLLAAILNERQVELFTELGHRWLDLKRTGKVDVVMNTVTRIKGGNWSSYKQLYPVQLNELLNNPYMIQTTGY